MDPKKIVQDTEQSKKSKRSPEGSKPGKVLVESRELGDLDSRIDTILAREGKLWLCSMCGKKNRERGPIRRHIEGIHIEGVSHPCTRCGKTLSSRSSLAAHGRKFHRKELGFR